MPYLSIRVAHHIPWIAHNAADVHRSLSGGERCRECKQVLQMMFVICSSLIYAYSHAGMQLEEPFSVLPLDKIANRLRLDVLEMMEHMQSEYASVCCLASSYFCSGHG